MIDMNTSTSEIQDKLGLSHSPVGIFLYEEIPAYALPLKKETRGCIATEIYNCSKGKVRVYDAVTTCRPCASFYLGYSEWIFPGIEKFLSNENVNGREPERFLKNPQIAKEFIESYVPEEKRSETVICKPLNMSLKNEEPEAVIFFANADQISALVFLISYGSPAEERIVTQFASACMSMLTVPLKYAADGKKKAVWGFHDLSARLNIPKEVMSLTMTFDLFTEVSQNLSESFVSTRTWERIKSRNL